MHTLVLNTSRSILYTQPNFQMRVLKKLPIQILVFVVSLAANAFGESQNWPGFRGPGATGVLEGHSLPTTWNADPAAENPEGVLWRASIPGLGHSSPVVWGDRIFVCTAIPEARVCRQSQLAYPPSRSERGSIKFSPHCSSGG